MKSRYDIIAVGDCTVDAFIRLHDASVHCDIHHERCQICMSFADKVPYETLEVIPAVGNSSNVAVGAARLGLRSGVVTAVGDDYYGRQILDVYKREGVSKAFVKINKGVETNYHFVLNFQAERTILIKHHDFAYYHPRVLDDVEWIYFSSMGSNTLRFHIELGRYLARHPNIKMGFNPGTFQLKLGRKKLASIYRRTHVLFINREEGQRILGIKNPNVKVLFRGLHAIGPRIVVITDGPAGSYASDGTNAYFMPPYPDLESPFERTGAGDAFSTGFMGGLIYGLPVTEALRWASANSMNVVRFTGAQKGLLTRPELLRLLRRAPKSFKLRRI
ncbi:carbohydrate kinase family protein [Candidatus Parcubacteria bacterium]|nr:MAG: carbohydrate kinase family protein [Candidatus Parcubacteria bacterium]